MRAVAEFVERLLAADLGRLLAADFGRLPVGVWTFLTDVFLSFDEAVARVAEPLLDVLGFFAAFGDSFNEPRRIQNVEFGASVIVHERQWLRALDDEMRELEYDSHAVKKGTTAHDIRDMNALGLASTFRRRFKFVAMVGFSSTVVVAWQNVLTTFGFALFNGGK